MRLQRIGISKDTIEELAVGSRVCLRDFKLTLENKLGLSAIPGASETIARYVVENQPDNATEMIPYDEDLEISDSAFVTRFTKVATSDGKQDWIVFSQSDVKNMTKELK